MFKIETEEKLVRYVRDVLDGAFRVESLSVQQPLFLRRYKYFCGIILGKKLLFAFVSDDGQSPSEYAKMAVRLQSEFGMPVVFVYERLAVAKRNALIRNSVPFVVPMLQLFLPPYLDLHERGVKIAESRRALRPASQALIIRQLVKGDVEGKTSKEMAAVLHYTQMTLSNVMSEIVELGLCEVEGWPKRIHFKCRGLGLWNAALPRFKSPVQKILPNAKPTPNFCVAGMTALSELSMVAPDPLTVYACCASDLKGTGGYERPRYEDEAKSVLQVWHYDPKICGDAHVDRLSLYLSLRDDDDPRVKDAVEGLLEDMKWQ